MKLSHKLLLALHNCLKTTHDSLNGFNSLIGLMDVVRLKVQLIEVVTGNEPIEQQQFLFIKELNTKGSISYFLNQYKTGYGNNPLVKKLFEDIDQYFEIDTEGNFRMKSELFDLVSLKKNSLPFIDRYPVKKVFYQMCHGDRSPVLVVQGQSRFGLSYLKNYFSDLATDESPFRFIGVDLRVDLEKDNEELVYPVHIGKYISALLEIKEYQDWDLSSDKEFKSQPFFTTFRVCLEKTEKKHIFFIDHFDETVSKEVYDFVLGLAKLFANDNVPGFLILSGVKDNVVDQFNNMDVPYEEEILTAFNEEDLRKYFSNIYSYCCNSDKGKELLPDTEDDFITSGMELFTKDNMISVEKVGKIAKIWYKTLRDKILDADNPFGN